MEWIVSYYLHGGDPPNPSYVPSYDDESRDGEVADDSKLTDDQREAIQEETERFDSRWQAGLRQAWGDYI